LVDPGGPLLDGRIYDSNSHSIATAVVLAGGVPRLIGIARDDLDEVARKLNEGLASDLLITSAGVSKGDFDIVKDVLANRGAMEFWSVRMRPAKPLAFGKLKLDDASDHTVPHLGLPGNPVSALIAFEHFGRPAIIKMLGRQPTPRPTIRAILTDSIVNGDGRRVFARVVVTKRNGKYYASLTGDQSSNLLTSMAQANGLAICPEELRIKKAGEEAEVLMMNWPPEVF
jgi:molybdopterin molybdotransferase